MDKKVFLEKLKDLITLEEGKQPLIRKHVPTALPLSGLKEDEYLSIQKELEQFAQMGEKHIEMLKSLKLQIVNSDQEVY